jgi:hypothetical protein
MRTSAYQWRASWQHEELTRENAGAMAAGFVRLLGDHVVEERHRTDGTLVLRFSRGGEVVIADNNPQYESYTIESPAGIIVV